MSTRLVVGHDDLRRCRFAISPLFEALGAVRAFGDPRQRAHLGGWWRAVRDIRDPGLAALAAVQPRRGYVPDFLSPPPSGSGSFRMADQLDIVRATPTAQVAEELRRCLADQDDPRAHARAAELAADPDAARDLLARALEDAWRRLVLPWWPRIRETLDADIVYRSRLLAERGLGQVVVDLHDRVSWTEDAVVVRTMADDRHELAGRGLVLIPSALSWPFVGVVTERPWQPALVYPARGVGVLGSVRPPTTPAALGRLIGRTRATVLVDLAEATSTSVLAVRHGLSAAGVSAHLTALRDAGLVVGRRHRHEVRYHRTALGDALVAGVMPED